MTTNKQNEINRFFQYIPTISILLFYGIYIYCVPLYPGGSLADLNASDFSWLSNYTCDLFHTHGVNGLPNPARPIGLRAVFIICAGLSLFFYQFSQIIPMPPFWEKAIPITGVFSMICAVLIFTDLHHIMVLMASIFGLFALIGVVSGIFTNKLHKYLWTGGACMLLLVLNNYFYYFDILTGILPLIQKISIFLVLTWVISLNFKLVNMQQQ